MIVFHRVYDAGPLREAAKKVSPLVVRLVVRQNTSEGNFCGFPEKCPHTYHINHHFSERLLLFSVEVYKDITVWVLKEFEGNGKMMVF